MTDESTFAKAPLRPRDWPTWLGIGLMWLLARIPWKLQIVIAHPLGLLLMYALPSRRNVAARNIELCFPELTRTQQQQLLRDLFISLGISVFEFGRAWWGSIDPLKKNLQIEGIEHVKAAQAEGKGVIVVSGHFTTLEVCGRLMCDYLPLAGMYRPHTEPAMEWAVYHGRMRYAAAMFSKHDVRGAIKYLKRGGLLWYAPDQDPRGGNAVYVPFFGQPAHSLTSTHQLARMSGARVIMYQHKRRKDGSYALKLWPAFDPYPTDDATTDTATVISAIETMVTAAPEQYLWIHRRFKRQPDGRKVYS